MVDPHPCRGGNGRFRAIGDAETGLRQHGEIIGTVADRHRGDGVEPELIAQAHQRLALRLAPENRLGHRAGEPVIRDLEPVGVVLVEADHRSDAVREQREPPGHQHRSHTQRPQGPHENARAGRQGDALVDHRVDRCDRQAPEQRDAFTERRFERDLPAHGTLGDCGDMVFQADEIGEFVDAFLLDHGRIHVGEEKTLAPVSGLLHDDVDRCARNGIPQPLFQGRDGFAARKGQIQGDTVCEHASLDGPRQRIARAPYQRRVDGGGRRGGNERGDERKGHGARPVNGTGFDAVLLAGPTASGKSAIALSLAQALGGTIVNTDSMQVYRDLAVITARPTPQEEAAAPHRLYGHVDAAINHSVGRWLAEAETAIMACRSEGRLPILTGGTGLYFKAVERGLAAMPAVPDEVRARIRAEATDVPPAELHRRLALVDPASAARLRPTDPQRLLRALEIFEATGRSLTDWQNEPHSPPLFDPDRCLRLFLSPEREILYARIDRRFDQMMSAGALDEVAALGQRGLDTALPAMRAHGVPWLLRAIAGTLPLDDAIAQAKADTRHYAKRQFTWFRHQMPGWQFVAPDAADALVRAALLR